MTGTELKLQRMNAIGIQPTANSFNLSQIQGLIGSANFGDIKGINSLFTIVNDAQQITSGDSNQQAQGVQNAIKDVMNLINKFIGQGPEAEASQKTAKNASDAAKTVAEASDVESQIKSSFSELQGAISGETDVIKQAASDLKEVQKELEEEQENIQKIIADIQAAQQELASTNDKEKQKELLVTIQGLTGQLSTSAANIVKMQETASKLSESVEQTVENIEEQNAGVFELQEEGGKLVAKLSEKAQQNAAETASTQAEVPVDTATSATAASMAATASSNFITGSTIAPKLYKTASAFGASAGIKQAGCAATFAEITQGIGKIGGSVKLINEFSTSIGSVLNDCIGYLGDWNTTIDPMITSFGSLGDGSLKEVGETLTRTVANDMATISGKTKPNNNEEIINNPIKLSIAAPKNNKTNNQAGNVQNTNNGLILPFAENNQANELETPKVKIQFGL